MIRALFAEILAKLESLLATGETNRIDLRRLPLPADGLHKIRDFLGEGEVHATVRGVGSCIFQETRTYGVWWMTQRNTAGDVIGEFIEVARVPELLKSGDVEIRDSVEDLRMRLATVGVHGSI
ncbi:hydrogenase expression/formation C-terminal domain-containing protein [Bradyrhizobium sp. BTAi1]|uniref:hydrogenase expression/formation C-terminal domain-containing protein n=1 Tax=Bradyrhizobium sp. (strain BTAi1 / ATCC BAA-1182) TaxID=288000 RepID=UPI0006746C9B|nr:hydrogenase expression/formation C-terminal domain-containing protein [Bradyrhizobium sp. BTAi1]